jgi:hypothetical protein
MKPVLAKKEVPIVVEKTPQKEVKRIALSMNDFKKFKFIPDISTRYEMGDFLG